MSKRETPFQAGLARSIRDHLRAAGSWPSRFSREIGHSESWLGDKLNPNRQATLTIPNIEEVAEYVEVDARRIVADAFPVQMGTQEARVLIHVLSEEHEARTERSIAEEDLGEAGQHLSASARDALEDILEKRPRVTKLEPEIDVGVLEEVQDSVWKNRASAFEKAVFQAEELAGRPRKLFTLVCVLALLSDLFRTLRTGEHGLRLRLLMHCYKTLDKYPHPGAAAVVAEKAAYFLWDVRLDADLSCTILEDASLTHHPILARLYSARAAFQHIGENHELALVQIAVAEQLTESSVLTACLRGMRGSVQIAMGQADMAVKTLEQTLGESDGVPLDLVSNNLALLGRACGTRLERERAIEYYKRALTPSYCQLWPDKAAYAALDLRELELSETELKDLQPTLVDIHKSLLPGDPVESELKAKIQEMLAAASTHTTNALKRRNMDPNG